MGKLPRPERTLGNHRRYRVQQAQADALSVGYVRVSSHDQKADLDRQRQFVQQHSYRPIDLVISDLGSGLNYKKAGVRRLLLLILQGNQVPGHWRSLLTLGNTDLQLQMLLRLD